MNKYGCLSFLLLSVLWCITANAEIYRWVDANGKVHYTDQPVEQGEAVELKKATINGLSQQEKNRNIKNKRWFEQQSERRQAKERKQAAVKRQRQYSNKSKKETCTKAKRKLARYQEELKNKKRAGMRVSKESWYKTKIKTLEFDVQQKC